MQTPDRLIIIDGDCGLCHGWVRFVIRFDRLGIFKFTSIQSDKGQVSLKRLRLAADCLETMVYVENNIVFTKSMAFLRIVRLLPFPAKLLYVFYIIPGFVRDFFYDYIAANRYRLFGRRDECALKDGKFNDRFI